MFPRAVWGFRLGGGGSVCDLGVQIGRRGFRLGVGGSDWAAMGGSDWAAAIQIGSGEGSDWGSDWGWRGGQIGWGFRLGGEGSDWVTDQTQSQLLLLTFWKYVYLVPASLEIQSSVSIH